MLSFLTSAVVLCLTLALQLTLFQVYTVDFGNSIIASSVDLPTGQTITNLEINTLTLGRNVYARYDKDLLIVNLGTASHTSTTGSDDCIVAEGAANYRLLWLINIRVTATVHVCGKASFVRTKAAEGAVNGCTTYLEGATTSITGLTAVPYSLTSLPRTGEQVAPTHCCRAVTYDPAGDCTFSARAVIYNFIPITIDICKQLKPFFLETDGSTGSGNGETAFPPLLPHATPTAEVPLLHFLSDALAQTESLFGFDIQLSFPSATAVHLRLQQKHSITLPDQSLRIEDVGRLLSSLPSGEGSGAGLPSGLKDQLGAVLEEMFGSLSSATGAFDAFDLDALLASATVRNPPIGLTVNLSAAVPAGFGLEADLVFPDVSCEASGNGASVMRTSCSVPRYHASDDTDDDNNIPFYVTNIATSGLSDVDLAVSYANKSITQLAKLLIGYYLLPVLPCAEASDEQGNTSEAGRCTFSLTALLDAIGQGVTTSDVPAPPLLTNATAASSVALLRFAENITRSVESVAGLTARLNASDAERPTAVHLGAGTRVPLPVGSLLDLLEVPTNTTESRDSEEGAPGGEAGDSVSLAELLDHTLANTPHEDSGLGSTTLLGGLLDSIRLRPSFFPWAIDLARGITIPSGASLEADVFVSEMYCDASTGLNCYARLLPEEGGVASSDSATQTKDGLVIANLRLHNATAMDGLLNALLSPVLGDALTASIRPLLQSLCGVHGPPGVRDGTTTADTETAWCFFTNTTQVDAYGFHSTVDTSTLPPLLPGRTPLSHVAPVGVLINVSRDVASVANVSVKLTSPAPTALVLNLETVGALDLVADWYEEGKRLLTGLVSQTLLSAFESALTNATQGNGSVLSSIVSLVKTVQLSPFLDEWVMDGLRHPTETHGVRLVFYASDVQCDASNGLDCAMALYTDKGATEATQTGSPALTLADTQLSVHPVLDLVLSLLLPPMLSSLFAAQALPALATSTPLCGSASARGDDRVCHFMDTSSSWQPPRRAEDFPPLYPEVEPTSAVPLLRAVPPILQRLTTVPCLSISADFPADSGFGLLVNLTCGMSESVAEAMLDSPLQRVVPELLEEFGGVQGLPEDGAALLSALMSTPYSSVVGVASDILGPSLASLLGGILGVESNVLSAFFADAFDAISFASDEATGRERTVGDFLGYLGPVPAGAVVGVDLFLRNLVCDSVGASCTLVSGGPPSPSATLFDAKASAPEEGLGVAQGIGLAALRLTPSSLVGILGTTASDAIVGPLNALLTSTLIPSLCGGDTMATSDCTLSLSQGRPVVTKPPVPFLIAYPIAAVCVSAVLAVLNVLRHRRYGLWYLAHPHESVGTARVFLEDFGFMVALFFLAGLYIASNTTTGASVSIGGEVVLYSFSLINTVEDMWASGLRFFAVFVMVFSGIFPYFKLLSLLVCTVVLQRPSCAFLSIIDALGKFSFVDTFIMFIFVSGLQVEGVVEVHAWPSYFLFMGATVGSVLAGNYGYDLYRQGTSSRLPMEERRAAVARRREGKEAGAKEQGDLSSDACVHEAGPARSDASTPPRLGNSVNHVLKKSPFTPQDGVSPVELFSPQEHDDAPPQEGVKMSSTPAAWEDDEPAGLDSLRGADEGERGDAAAFHLPTPERLQVPTGSQHAHSSKGHRNNCSNGSGSETDKAEGAAASSSTNPSDAGTNTLAQTVRRYVTSIWWQVSVPAFALVFGFTVPAWCIPCVVYTVGGIAQLLTGPPQSYTLYQLATGPDAATATLTIVTVVVAPALYAAAYPRSSFLGSWTAADVVLCALIAALEMNTLIQFMLGGQHGSTAFLYSAHATLRWPMALLGIAALAIWGLQLTHFFKLHRRVPQFLRWLSTRRRRKAPLVQDLDAEGGGGDLSNGIYFRQQ